MNKAKHFSWHSVGLFLISAASLCFEINLTRLFSVGQFYHFAFMVVSIALLGYSASGTFLALKRKPRTKSLLRDLPWLAGAASLCMLGAFFLINQLPFDSFSMVVDPTQAVILLLHYAALASPFFFVGMIISLILGKSRSASGETYAVNLVGSAVGCLVAVLIPSWVGGEGVVAFSAMLAALAGWFFTIETKESSPLPKSTNILRGFLRIILITTSALIGFSCVTGNQPAFFELTISPYKSISYALQNPQAELLSSQWNGYSRVDVVSSPSLHSVPGLSYRYLESIPQINALFIDGDNQNAILDADADMSFASFLPSAIVYQLRPEAQALILEPNGGMDVLVALALGAREVTVVEANPLIMQAVQDAYSGEKVQRVNASGRSFLLSSRESYEIIQLPLTDSYHPVSSGAYALGEDYRYTLEAFTDMIDSLSADGILVITRWLQEQPSEWLRTFTLTVTALDNHNLSPHDRIIALRGYNTGTLLVKKSPFTAAEMDKIKMFTDEKAFDLVFAPDSMAFQVNRFNILPEPIYFNTFQNFLTSTPRESFYKTYPYDVSPPTDDHPFFGHYFKWLQFGEIIRTLGITWQPFGGAGYLVVLLIFFIALILAGILIFLPVLAIRNRGVKQEKKHPILYFGLIGLAFMLVEVPLMQQFILYLDQPAYAFAAVLFCILLFSGLGSVYGSRKLRLYQALTALVGILSIYSFLLSKLIHATLGLPLFDRLALTILLIAPVGFLMGIPFPGGLRSLKPAHSGQLTDGQSQFPLIWAVNGAASVVASILASLLALSFGFNLTAVVGTGFYLLALLVVLRQKML